MDLSISAADKVVVVGVVDVFVVAAGKMSATFLAAGTAAAAAAGVATGVVLMGAGSFFSSSSNLTKSSPLSMSIKLELLIGGCMDVVVVVVVVVAADPVVSDDTGTATVFSLSVATVADGCVVVEAEAGAVAIAGKLDTTLSVLVLTAEGFFSSPSLLFLSDSGSSSSSILSATPLAALAKRTFCNSDLSFGPNMAEEKLFRCVLVVALDVLAK